MKYPQEMYFLNSNVYLVAVVNLIYSFLSEKYRMSWCSWFITDIVMIFFLCLILTLLLVSHVRQSINQSISQSMHQSIINHHNTNQILNQIQKKPPQTWIFSLNSVDIIQLMHLWLCTIYASHLRRNHIFELTVTSEMEKLLQYFN